MTTLTDISDADALLALSPEDLVPIVLNTLVAGKPQGLPMHSDSLTYAIYERDRRMYEARFPTAKRDLVESLLGEAWQLMLAERLIMPEPGYNGRNGFVVLTNRGKTMLEGGQTFRGMVGRSFSKEMLHPSIADTVWKALARGDLENAVLVAFRTVEIAVREAGKLGADDVGTVLMRKAFHSENGLLTDKSLPAGEREALPNLFAGAIGYFKNPQSHRELRIDGQQRAQEIVLFASLLLYIVDASKK